MIKKKSLPFNMNLFDSTIILLLLAIFSLAHSIPSEDLEAVYRENGCQEGECEVLELNFFNRRKRSTDSKITFPLRAFGREKILHLEESSGILVGPNTPVYFATSSSEIKVSYPLASALARSQFYEDKENMAAFTFNVDADGKKTLKYGRIGSENITITPLNLSNNSSNRSEIKYLARLMPVVYVFPARNDIIYIPIGQTPIYPPSKPVPEKVYAEILVILDYKSTGNIDSIYKLNDLLDQVIVLWNHIDELYSSLTNPRIKLAIAGIVIPQNPSVFNFMLSEYGVIDFDNVLEKATVWLTQASNTIPYNSYDFHMIMTPQQHINETTLGLTQTPSACRGFFYNVPFGGVFRVVKNVFAWNQWLPHDFVATAAHEIGHALGLNHDSGPDKENSLMKNAAGSRDWTEHSRKELTTSMQRNQFTCLYNEPQVGKIKKNFPKPDNSFQGSDSSNTNSKGYDSDNINFIKKLELRPLASVSDEDILVIEPSDIPIGRLLMVFFPPYQHLTFVYHAKPVVPSDNVQEQDLRIRQPDSKIIAINPLIMNQRKSIYVAHDNGYIYVYQMAD